MVDPKLGKQVLGVPIPEARPPPSRRGSIADTCDEPRSERISPNEFATLMGHLQGVEERYQAEIAELRRELDAVSERASKLPSTPPGNVDISKGPQGLRVRGPAGYALAIAALLFAAVALWQLKPLLTK